ncbi:hypothetical protein CXG81DRAFT_28730 [Caulochytrium protostelioides]|nr:hypothetical protein CXG81DRAFT_28730 [Caulochytrium protostelioides]|eukprot:RKO98438.1 hypothetical protein CXG81DRAFT_28730 [Caulochytrium protostelioides]
MGAMGESDKAILRALQRHMDHEDDDMRNSDNDSLVSAASREGRPGDSDTDGDDDGEHGWRTPPKGGDGRGGRGHGDGEERLPDAVRDAALRRQAGLGGAMTGPKGVIADRAFHARQQAARRVAKQQADRERLDRGALKSGWLQRQIAAEQDTDDVDRLFAELEAETDALAGSAALAGHAPRFLAPGTFTALATDTFLDAVDGVPGDNDACLVAVHLYDPSHAASRVAHEVLAHIATRHPLALANAVGTLADGAAGGLPRHRTALAADGHLIHPPVRFAELPLAAAPIVLSHEALPALLVYRRSPPQHRGAAGNGVLQSTLLRMTDAVPGWAESGRCDPDELVDFLIKEGVLYEP